MMMPFIGSQKQQTANRHIPIGDDPRERLKKTRVMMLSSCALWYHEFLCPSLVDLVLH